MIPKIIHYIWVGDSEMPEELSKCVESWRKFAPDYELVLWDNQKIASINNKYLCEAIKMKKWAFASDMIRLQALYNYGGLYFDTDLELTRSIDDFLNLKGFFSGFEKYKNGFAPVTALMGSEKSSKFVGKLLSYYDDRSFIKANGDLDTKTNTETISEYLYQEGLPKEADPSCEYHLMNNIHIYPYFYFCSPETGKINFSIHHFFGSWVDSHKILFSLNLFGVSIAIFKRKRSFSKRKFYQEGRRFLFSFGRFDLYC